MFLAGGSLKPGISYSKTDEFGYKPVENHVSMRDLHAIILHQWGLDHEQLTHRWNRHDQTLTNGLRHVIDDIIS